jgi:Ser/Thr protein kinase RdoA (MazF antagonist)
MLQRNIKIQTILEDMGIPVGGIVLTKDKKTYAIDNEYYYILMNKLSGSNIADVHENTAIASEMGRVLARLHKAFKECETQDEFWDNSLLKEMNGWIKDVWVKNNWKYIDESEFSILKYFFAGYEQEHKLLPEEKQAVPYVMEAIELLFVAWFIEQNDIKCAEDAMKIYQFAEKNVERILKVIQ